MSRKLMAVAVVLGLVLMSSTSYAGCCGKGKARRAAGGCGAMGYAAGAEYGYAAGGGGCGGASYAYAQQPCSPCQMTQSVPVGPVPVPTQQAPAPQAPMLAPAAAVYSYGYTVTWRRGWRR